ncbi:MAG: metal-binding protein [Synechococcus sp.]
MASGRDHDRATLLGCTPFGLALTPWLGLDAGVIGAGAFVVGGLWLSPDLDTFSKPLQRWGPLRWLWWPYRRLIPHRSLFSHGPLIGMTLRLLWVLVWVLVGWMLLSWALELLMGMPTVNPSAWAIQVRQSAQAHPHLLWATGLGLEASVWLHLVLDGDPMPVEWQRRRRRRHRRSPRR